MNAVADWFRYQNITIGGWFAIVMLSVVAGCVAGGIAWCAMGTEGDRHECAKAGSR